MAAQREASRESLRQSLTLLLRLSASRRGFALRMATVGLALPQQAVSVLDHVVEHGPLPMGELARGTRHDPGATARLVAGLEADGLLQRRRSTADGRVSLVHVTAQGRRTAALVASAQVRHLDRALAPLSDLELATCAAHLERVVGLLRDVDGAVPAQRDGRQAAGAAGGSVD
ncbi:MAG: MarR family transcriptional regulator [Mycobacteriales bacterium]|nr:MarR family transcriptional regulator [Mycobacteriales bacterium]